MILKSIHLSIPNAKPFDRENWFESFVGNFIMPIISTVFIDSYWFTRYSDQNIGKHARFRIKTSNYSLVKPHVDELIAKYDLTDLADEENWDGVEFRDRRFIGQNQRQTDPHARQELIWDFLYASSRLYVDTFSHSDSDGYWYREENHDRDNNIDGDTMESPHHLFCNLTDLQPRVDLLASLAPQGSFVLKMLSSHYRKWSHIPDEVVRASQRVQF